MAGLPAYLGGPEQACPARHRTTSWSSDNAAPRWRGSLLVGLDREMERCASTRGRPGRPETLSDAAIQFCLLIKVLFGLALRQTIGMVASLLRLAGLDWPVPDFSTLCRRQSDLTVSIPCRRSGGNLSLLIDSTGVKVRGDGEWQVRKHGPSRLRQWRKVPLAMDLATGDIWAVEFTSSRKGDRPVPPGLLAEPPPDQPVGSGAADGAYDTRKCHSAIVEHGGTAVIPIRRNGGAWKDDGPAARASNETLRAAQCFGRALRKRLTGHHARSRGETQMPRLKSFGERSASKDPNRQAAEIHTRIAPMNRFSALRKARNHPPRLNSRRGTASASARGTQQCPRRCHTAIILIHRNERPWKEDCAAGS